MLSDSIIDFLWFPPQNLCLPLPPLHYQSHPAWILAVKRSSRRVWLAHFVESLNIQGGLPFEAAPGSPFVSEAALFILTYAKWSLTWSKPQKNTSGTSEVLSLTSFRVLFYTIETWLMDELVCFYIILWFVDLATDSIILKGSFFIGYVKQHVSI